MRMLRVGLRLSPLAKVSRPLTSQALAVGLRHQFGSIYVARSFATSNAVRSEAKSKPVASEKSGAASSSPSSTSLKSPSEKTIEEAQSEDASKEKEKPTVWQKVKREVGHFWEGTKLLGYELKVSSKLAFKLASGRELSRREDRQLKRTLQDIVRLVPFSMFVLVPFAELLLPVALKLFPNMLPSTYESATAKSAKLKKLGNTRKDVGKYLRTSIQGTDMVVPKFSSEEQQQDFEEFFRQIRDGERPSRTRLLNVARTFKDDLLLDNFTRPQLSAIAKYMNIQGFGTSIILRYRIRHKMKMIKQDDRVIDYEGVDSLNALELNNACQSRGFKTIGVSTGRLREDLTNWLQLRLHDRVPSSLLILSSAYNYGDHDLDSAYDALLAVLSALPPEVYHETELEISSTQATNAQRLEVLKEQDELIREENKEEQESGHVIQVRDNLNLDEEEPKPTTESEANVKADQVWYEETDKKNEKLEKFDSQEADSRKPVESTHPTVSESAAKADEELAAEVEAKKETNTHKPAESHPTASESAAKADQEFVEQVDAKKETETHKPSESHPTDSESAVKADQEFVDPKKAKKTGTQKPTESTHPTDSESAVKADQEFIDESKKSQKA